MLRARMTLAVAALLASTPAVARAQTPPAPLPPTAAAIATPGDDEVTLKNGGMIRGTMVSVEPEKQVVIMVASGESRVIAWAEIDRVERGKHAQRAPAAVPQAPVAPPMPAAPMAPERGFGMPQVHIESDSPAATLQEVVANMEMVGGFSMYGGGGGGFGVGSAAGSQWRPICQAPCDTVVDGRRGSDFFITGPGISPSRSFRLARATGDVTMKVNTGSNAVRIAGWVFVSLGAATAVSGVGIVARDQGSSATVGGVMMGIATPFLVGGIIMVLVGRTTVELSGTGTEEAKVRRWTAKAASVLTTGTVRF